MRKGPNFPTFLPTVAFMTCLYNAKLKFLKNWPLDTQPKAFFFVAAEIRAEEQRQNELRLQQIREQHQREQAQAQAEQPQIRISCDGPRFEDNCCVM